MKRIPFFLVAAVLLLTGAASADLSVHDYLGNGQLVVEDTQPGGNYWYWNLADFVSKTYDEQIAAIAVLNIAPPYGNIAGGWHMADHDEMSQLWGYSRYDLESAFGPSYTETQYADPEGGGFFLYTTYSGRSNHEYDTDNHYTPSIHLGTKYGLHDSWVRDDEVYVNRGAWVTTSSSVVPVPGAFILAALGLLTVGAKLRRHKR